MGLKRSCEDDDELEYKTTKKLRISTDSLESSDRASADVETLSIHRLLRAKASKTEAVVRVPCGRYPQCAFLDFDGADEKTHTESDALDTLLAHYPPLSSPDQYVDITLSDFEIYRPQWVSKHEHTLASLNELQTVRGDSTYCFSGRLCYKDLRIYVKDVEFSTVCNEGYGDDNPYLSGLFIQSNLNRRKKIENIYYRLEDPTEHYAPYHRPFIWLATFAKFFVEFCVENDQVELHHFRSNFLNALGQKYGQHNTFKTWHGLYGRRDFRQVVAAHVEYLWKEATGIDDSLRDRQIWSECDPLNLSAIREQPIREANTVVTPYIHNCFKHMYFAHCLKVGQIRPKVFDGMIRRAKRSNLSVLPSSQQSLFDEEFKKFWCAFDSVKMGDVVVLDRDNEGHWQDSSAMWYAYVQGVKKDAHGEYLELIWLYRPSETICDQAFYPQQAELFFSDHCNCEDHRIRPRDVKALLVIQLLTSNAAIPDGPFVRQMYVSPDEELQKDAAFMTLQESHLRCSHLTPEWTEVQRMRQHFPPRTTALAKITGSRFLQPVVVSHLQNEDLVKVRILKKRQQFDRGARPNELLETEEVRSIKPAKIIRRCYIRSYDAGRLRRGDVPSPYSYNGAADCWCITGRLESSFNSVLPLDVHAPLTYIPGFDPSAPRNAMSGLSVFSGGGLFDRGIEESGVVRTKFAVETSKEALHTHRANLEHPNDVSLYLGSVNDYLAQALKGETSSRGCSIASVEDVHFLIGGSPCKFFSRANQDKTNVAAHEYASLVASLLAFVNFYLPDYAILENVFDMTKNALKDEKQNVFSQVIATLVGMGYQVQTFLVDAWAHGSSQARSRIMIMVTAPGFTPPEKPPQTHSHPAKVASRAMGKTKSGIRYGMREMNNWTSHDYVSLQESISDLPFIGEGLVRTNVPFPDHRLITKDGSFRAVVPQFIPRFPLRSNYHSSVQAAFMPRAVQEMFSNRSAEWRASNSRAFKRIDPTGLAPVVKTLDHPDDSRHGACLHPDQHRTLTLMEARRAQCIPDHEVLIGLPAKKWEIVGNGVDRKASVAVGMMLREAWLSEQTQTLLRVRAQLLPKESLQKPARQR